MSDNEYYRLLGVSQTASKKDIRSAFRKLAIKKHPDKGGDPEEFKRISEAYATLSDDKKRQMYDKFGKDGPSANNGFPQDIFSMFQRRGHTQHRHIRKAPPIIRKVQMPLTSLYCGKTISITYMQTKIIDSTGVEQTNTNIYTSCMSCHGTGRINEIRQFRAGFLQQIQKKCIKCAGSGFSLKDGYRTTREQKRLTINVKGMRNEQKVVFEGKGNFRKGCLPGDMVIVILEQPHPVFKRKGNDLLIMKELSLKEALCGTTFQLQHLDGTNMDLSTTSVIKPGAILVVPDLGMPKPDTLEHGHLFVKFNICFPEFLTDIQRNSLMSMFDEKPKIRKKVDDEHKYVLRKTELTCGQVSDDDDDDNINVDEMHNGVQCQQQ